MKFWHAIRQFISVSWLVAPFLVIIVFIIISFLFVQVIDLLISTEAAATFGYGVLMVLLAIIGVPIYALASYLRSEQK